MNNDTNSYEPIETIRSDGTESLTRSWRADLWGNVPQAINWANQAPTHKLAGEIIFNIRDNGQVWTYTLGSF